MKAEQPLRANFDFYGVRVSATSSCAEILEWLSFDFLYFKADEEGSPALSVSVVIGEIPPDIIPPIEESIHAPSCVSYDCRNLRFVDYYGRAVVKMDYANEQASLWSADAEFAYEKLYLLILSRVGEHLDRRGLHRVHALGFSFRDEACLVLLPMRAGKSTLALSLLKMEDARLYSEDTPLIDRQGLLHAFPLRLGVREGETVPEEMKLHSRVFQRSEFGPKILISSAAFSSRIARLSRPVSTLIIGKWTRALSPSIRSAGRIYALGKLFRDCVFGLGLPQVVEYFLRTPLKDLLTKTPLTLSRIWACMRICACAHCIEILLSPDREKNNALLALFLSGQDGR